MPTRDLALRRERAVRPRPSDEIWRVLLKRRLHDMMDLGVGMQGAAAFDRHPFRIQISAPRARAVEGG
jgi:hypothetical protein